MPGYAEVLEMLGPEGPPLSEREYLEAVRLTERKAKKPWQREVILPYVIKDLVFARWVNEGGRA